MINSNTRMLVRQFNIAGISETTFRKVLTGASAAYMIYKRVPSVEEIHEYSGCSKKSISMVLATPEFKQTMQQRGYAWDNHKLTPEQEFAVGIITDPSRRGDLNSKLKAAGISYSQYRAWMKQPHFSDFISKIGEDMLGENLAIIHTAVVNKAGAGDINAAKLVYELTGRHDPARQQMLDLGNVVGLLLEVITRHVRDVTVLNAITQDVEIVMSGKTPKTLTSFSFADDSGEGLEVLDADVVGYVKEEASSEVVESVPVGNGFFDFEKE